MNKSTQRTSAFAFGVVFIVVLLVLALVEPNPTPFQYMIFRAVLALAAAGVAAMIPGFIEVSVAAWIRAGGAVAVFILVYFYNPAALVAEPLSVPAPLSELRSDGVAGIAAAEYRGSAVQLFEGGWLMAQFAKNTLYAVSLAGSDQVRWCKRNSEYVKGVDVGGNSLPGDELLRLGFRWFYFESSETLARSLGRPLTNETRAWVQFQRFEDDLLVYGLPSTKDGIESGQFQILSAVLLENELGQDEGGGRIVRVSEGSLEGMIYCSANWYPALKNRRLPPMIVRNVANGDCARARGPQDFTAGSPMVQLF